MRRQLLCASCLIAGLFVAHAGGVPAVSYVIVDLGTLGGSQTQPVALNERGQVTGWSRTADNAQHAFLFTNGQMLDLGTLGGSSSQGNAINDDGEVAGRAATSSSTHAFLYTGGRMHDLGTIAGDFSEALALNASGQVTGRSSTADGRIHGFLFSGGSMIDLGTLGGPGDSAGVAINASGQITGSADLAAVIPFPHEVSHAFLYSGGVMTDIVGVPDFGDTPSSGLAINDLGHVLYEKQDPTEIGQHFFLFLNSSLPAVNIGVMTVFSPSTALNERDQIAGTVMLPPPPGLPQIEYGFLYSDGVLTNLTREFVVGGANGLNNAGDVVGFAAGSLEDVPHAFLFTHGAAIDLNSVVPTGSGWVLINALAINDKGQIIGVGQRGAFLLNPVDRIPTSKDQCKNGGWAQLIRANGSSFKNQGDCASYVNTGK